eukprot:CAMPEP_0175799338 /NCGR_PEP_ID=MMETSP0097-20121207/86448_1 /TAXON_ID=311494 /ORGANISM="Alexandrium monilatum, Strain CCMP3105" /LENGTH=53 /DNA_ID=CAMNT_0017110589 /DNA_START=11 /DNA_END=169 /DNA_ORIENTATION=+
MAYCRAGTARNPGPDRRIARDEDGKARSGRASVWDAHGVSGAERGLRRYPAPR